MTENEGRDVGAPEPQDGATPAPPVSGSAARLVVGIGASAGGLDARERLFGNMPPDTGMAFVVVTHAPGGRVSLLPGLLSRHTSMPLVPVDKPTAMQPNKIFVANGGEKVLLRGGVLLPSPAADGPVRNIIDTLFRSLAEDAGERAIGVVLSGTGSDGTLGIKEIKAQSGMTMAQEETSARFSSMPHSAIASLQVDYVLEPEHMAQQLLSYVRAFLGRSQIRPEETASKPDQMARLFGLLRGRTGHDFSAYKGTTIRRRIERRMNVHQSENLRDYVQLLQKEPKELDKLFKELLIGVTSFFRDPEAHAVLTESILPQLLQGKAEGEVLRAWTAGCSTGEEAYSLAIEIKEAMDKLRVKHPVQIFATDVDAEAIEVARAGEYAESALAEVAPQRLERFFTHEESGFYRIKKEIREMLVFAPHSLIEDPPFTKLDLLSCRNLLIYLEGRLQQQLMPLFHYSLRPGGVLFLGTSESVGGFSHLFQTLDKKWKVFRRKEGASTGYLADMPPSGEGSGRNGAGDIRVPRLDPTLVLSAERALLHNLVPPSVLMHERGDIVHIHGRTGMFLEPAPGSQSTANVYTMAREGLQLDLAVAVRHARASDGPVIHKGVKVKSNGHHVVVDLRVKRLSQPDNLRGLYLVAFEGAEPFVPESAPASPEDRSQDELATRTRELERELSLAKQVHQSTMEELETTNEELKSTNEELQSTNEELQSANEELETSKEEMQSLNEELQTVNAELQGKVEELSRANDDMKNLLNGTDIATIFLDNRLNIKRFTDQTRRVIRLIPSDVGRPVADLVSKLKYFSLAEDAQEVLRSLVFKEAEVQAEEGAWYLMRMLPYRTTENVIDGLVVTFVDISKIKALQQEALGLMTALASAPAGIFGQDAELGYQWAVGNVAGMRVDQVVGRRDEDLFAEAAAPLTALKREVIENGQAMRRRIRLRRPEGLRDYDIYVSPVPGADGKSRGVSGVIMALDDGSPKQGPDAD